MEPLLIFQSPTAIIFYFCLIFQSAFFILGFNFLVYQCLNFLLEFYILFYQFCYCLLWSHLLFYHCLDFLLNIYLQSCNCFYILAGVTTRQKRTLPGSYTNSSEFSYTSALSYTTDTIFFVCLFDCLSVFLFIV